MLIDASQYDADEFGFYLQTNGTVDARLFRDFLDLICGNSYTNRDFSPARVEIVEFATGSIRGRLRAWFEDVPWSKRKERRTEQRYRRNLAAAKSAMRRGDAEAHDIAVSATANDIADRANKLVARQNGIALVTFLSGVVATIYANATTSDAERISDLMEIDGVARIEIATRSHSWTILREDIDNYRERATRDVTEPGHEQPRGRSDRPQVPGNFIVDYDGTSVAITPGEALARQPGAKALPRRRSPSTGVGHWVEFAGHGTIVRRDGTAFFRPDQARESEMLLVVAPPVVTLTDGARLKVHGEAHIGSGHDVLVIYRATPQDETN